MIYHSDIRNFVEVEKKKLLQSKSKKPTIMDLVKDHNHEIWRICGDCGKVFDLRNELKIECPKCKSKNLVI